MLGLNMILTLVLCCGIILEEKRIENCVNPPQEYYIVSKKKIDLIPHPTFVVINDSALSTEKGKEVGMYNKKRLLMVDKKTLVKNKLKSENMMPVFTNNDGFLIFIGKTITVSCKTKEAQVAVHKFAKDKKLESKNNDSFQDWVNISFTNECPYVSVLEAARAFGNIHDVNWSQANFYFQIQR